MSDLFEEDDAEPIEIVGDFDEADLEVDTTGAAGDFPDARRRLEKMLDEKRLKDELEDFGDF